MYGQQDMKRVEKLKEMGFEVEESLEVFNTTSSGTSLMKITAPQGTVLVNMRASEGTLLATLRTVAENAGNLVRLLEIAPEEPIFQYISSNFMLNTAMAKSMPDDTLYIIFKKGKTHLIGSQKVTERNEPILSQYSRDAVKFMKNLVRENLLNEFKALEFPEYNSFVCEQIRSEGILYSIIRIGECASRADTAQILILKDNEEADIFSKGFLDAVKKLELLNAF